MLDFDVLAHCHSECSLYEWLTITLAFSPRRALSRSWGFCWSLSSLLFKEKNFLEESRHDRTIARWAGISDSNPLVSSFHWPRSATSIIYRFPSNCNNFAPTTSSRKFFLILAKELDILVHCASPMPAGRSYQSKVAPIRYETGVSEMSLLAGSFKIATWKFPKRFQLFLQFDQLLRQSVRACQFYHNPIKTINLW